MSNFLHVQTQDQSTGLWSTVKIFEEIEYIKTGELEHHRLLWWTWTSDKEIVKRTRIPELRKMAREEATRLMTCHKVRIVECGNYTEDTGTYIKEVIWKNGEWL